MVTIAFELPWAVQRSLQRKELAMSKWIAVCMLSGMLAVVGCKSMDKTDSSEPKKMSADACSHCDGVQTATADGKCPVCGMKVQ
jgi:uncharacterized paraquat-inducible protein A